ncbi:MAG: hypothetical protein JW768_02785 [Chitinispirillaceae bacterium]|nr:hypothetical protein [Chitinispirillaceae bacterium]
MKLLQWMRQASFIATLFAVLFTYALSCIPLANMEPVEQFRMVRATETDTVSPYDSLLIAFTYPVLQPDSASFEFIPPFFDFQQAWNERSDTVTFWFAQPLEGRTHFRLVLQSTVESVEGSLLRAGEDTISFHTHASEQEPNDTRETADPFSGTVFGSVSTANDSDWFAIEDTSWRSFYLKSSGSFSLFDIRDAGGSSVRPSSFAEAETLAIPDTFVRPVHLVVFAYNRSNGGHYELGAVR